MEESQQKRRRTMLVLPGAAHCFDTAQPPYQSEDVLAGAPAPDDPAPGQDGYSKSTESNVVVQPVVLEPGAGFYKDTDYHVWELFGSKWWLRVHGSQGTFAWENWAGTEPIVSLESEPGHILGPGFWKDRNHCIWQRFRAQWWHHKRDSTGACEWIRWPDTSQ